MPKDNKLLTKEFLAISDSRYQLKKFQLGLKEEFKPEGFYENLLVDKLMADLLRLRKALIYEKDHIFQDDGVDNVANNNKISQLTTYIKNIEKSIQNDIKALNEFKKEKKLSKMWPFS